MNRLEPSHPFFRSHNQTNTESRRLLYLWKIMRLGKRLPPGD